MHDGSHVPNLHSKFSLSSINSATIPPVSTAKHAYFFPPFRSSQRIVTLFTSCLRPSHTKLNGHTPFFPNPASTTATSLVLIIFIKTKYNPNVKSHPCCKQN